MFKRLYNELILLLDIEPVDPILIKSGVATLDGPDMSFVETYRAGTATPYLPGSSLKGCIRSHAERLARTEAGERASVCMPFARQSEGRWEPEGATEDDEACGTRWTALEGGEEDEDEGKRRIAPAAIYRLSCPACRLFGSTSMLGRVAIGDAYPKDGKPSVERRDGVGIDRFTGGASRGAKFDLQVVTAGRFRTRLDLKNFELWQLGWLAYVLWDMQEENFWIGSGKSRGLGRVKGTIAEAQLSYLGAHRPPAGQVWGVGSCMGAGAAAPYDFQHPDVIELAGEYKPAGLRQTLRLDGPGFWNLASPAGEKWRTLMEGYTRPSRQEMRQGVDHV
jgi:CRISPR-associated RAMP protein (TIGR02581 family)